MEALFSPTVGHSDIAMVIERDYIQSVGTATVVNSGTRTCSVYRLYLYQQTSLPPT